MTLDKACTKLEFWKVNLLCKFTCNFGWEELQRAKQVTLVDH